jgi:hypothetical protein
MNKPDQRLASVVLNESEIPVFDQLVANIVAGSGAAIPRLKERYVDPRMEQEERDLQQHIMAAIADTACNFATAIILERRKRIDPERKEPSALVTP